MTQTFTDGVIYVISIFFLESWVGGLFEVLRENNMGIIFVVYVVYCRLRRSWLLLIVCVVSVRHVEVQSLEDWRRAVAPTWSN